MRIALIWEAVAGSGMLVAGIFYLRTWNKPPLRTRILGTSLLVLGSVLLWSAYHGTLPPQGPNILTPP